MVLWVRPKSNQLPTNILKTPGGQHTLAFYTKRVNADGSGSTKGGESVNVSWELELLHEEALIQYGCYDKSLQERVYCVELLIKTNK